MEATERQSNAPTGLEPAFADLLLSVADDKLLLGHRNSDWTGLGPILEEDIAFSSLAQDEIAHAQALYAFAGTLLGQDENQLAFGRGPDAYRSASIVEVPDGFDWSVALARKLFCDHFDLLRLERLARSSHAELAALARRLVAEERIHVEHVDGWIKRLGGGTDQSRKRIQAAIDTLAPHAGLLHEPVADQAALESAGLYPVGDGEMFAAWHAALTRVTDEAGLTLHLDRPAEGAIGGRRGRHTEHLAPLLDEMCEVFRTEPTAAW